MMETRAEERRANYIYPRAYQFATVNGCICIVFEENHTTVLYSSQAGWQPAGVREIADRA